MEFLKAKLAVFLMAFLMVIGCGVETGCNRTSFWNAKPPQNVPIEWQTTKFKFHSDVDFKESERLEVQKAADLWESQTLGVVHIDMVYDLDFNSPSSLIVNEPNNCMVSLTSDLDIVKRTECRNQEALGQPCDGTYMLLGLTQSDIHQAAPIRMGLVVDRAQGEKLRRVVLHEMGHALGLNHVTESNAIMFPSTNMGISDTCLHKADMVEFCVHNNCKPETMKACGE